MVDPNQTVTPAKTKIHIKIIPPASASPPQKPLSSPLDIEKSPETAEELANLLNSYKELVEQADKKSDKQLAQLYKNKVKLLCSSYRIAGSARKSNDQTQKLDIKMPFEISNSETKISKITSRQFQPSEYAERVKEWESLLDNDFNKQISALEKRILERNKNKDSPEAIINTECTDPDQNIQFTGLKLTSCQKSEGLKSVQNLKGLSPEVVMQNLEESIHKLNEDKAKVISQLVESIAREKYAEIVKVEEKYAKEIEKCKVSSSLFKAVLQKLNEKKDIEIKTITQKYTKKQTDAINSAQIEFSTKLSDLYENVKKIAKNMPPAVTTSGKLLMATPTHKGRFGLTHALFPSKTPNASKKHFVFPSFENANNDMNSPM